jgi:anion transporter
MVILALGWTLPPPPGLSEVAWHALVVLLAALPALALDALLEGVLALLIASAWVVFGITTPVVALTGFASTNWVFVVAALIIGAAITSTGVLYRFALESIAHMRGGFPGEVTALSLAGLLIGPAVPNTTGRVIMIAPMLKDLVEALGYRPQSKAAAGLAMAALVGFGQMAAMFLTSSTTAVMVLAVLPARAREDVNWITWTLYAAPINVVLFGGLLASILWLYWPAAVERQPSNKRAASLALQRALLGPMSRDEKIALGVGIGLLAGFMTEPLHGVDPSWIAVLATGVLTATGVVTVNTLRAVNWNFALLYGVLISLAAVFGHTGLDHWIADRVSAVGGDLLTAPAVFVVGLAVLCFAISFFVRWQAAAPLITIALVPVASVSGVHPVIVGLVAVVACNGFFLPYQSTSYLALYAGTAGKLFTHRQVVPVALAYAAWTIVAIILSVPLWRLMRLM